MKKIKIKKSKLSADKITDELKVDLRNNSEKKPKQPSKKWLFLSIFLILVIIGLSVGLFFSVQKKLAFNDLVPEQAVIFSLIDQPDLYEQVSPFYQLLRENGFYDQGAISKIGDYLNQAGLNLKEDIQPLFKKQAAFVLMPAPHRDFSGAGPANSETSFPFLLLFKKQASLDGVNHLLSQIEPVLKKDYNFSSQIYRQIEITVLKPLFPPSIGKPDLYAYSQIEDYFIISNSQESLRMIIDSIINR